jgi:hypothetical protein
MVDMSEIKSGRCDSAIQRRLLGCEEGSKRRETDLYAHLLFDKRRSEENERVGRAGNMGILLFTVAPALVVSGIVVGGWEQEGVGLYTFGLLWRGEGSVGYIGSEGDVLGFVNI